MRVGECLGDPAHEWGIFLADLDLYADDAALLEAASVGGQARVPGSRHGDDSFPVSGNVSGRIGSSNTIDEPEYLCERRTHPGLSGWSVSSADSSGSDPAICWK